MVKLLELSISTDEIIKDMGLYADLGFQERPVNEAIQHHYGVMGDACFSVGLHNADFSTPTLTYVVPEIAKYAPTLNQMGIEFERAVLGDEQFNQISFLDPLSQRVNLIEARTFSPTFDDDLPAHKLGKFSHVELPHTDERETFWTVLEGVLNPAIASDTDNVMLKLHTDCQRVTAVYQTDLDALIMHSAQRGWSEFSITANNCGLFRTPHGFDLRFERLAS